MIANIEKEYDQDFYAWITHNVKLLREGKLSEIDAEHIAEEIESMGKSEKRELINRLAVLIAHLLKWQHQPIRRSQSWSLTIKEQRIQLISLLEDSPSLRNEIEKKLEDAYEQAVLIAERETALEEKTFSKSCVFSLDEILNKTYFPE